MNQAVATILTGGRTAQQYEEMEAAFVEFLKQQEVIENEDDPKLDWNNRIPPAHPYCNGNYRHPEVRLAFKAWIELWFNNPNHQKGTLQ